MATNNYLCAQRHHREARCIVNKRGTDALLGKVLGELLAGEVGEGLTANHLHSSRGDIPLGAGGGDEITNDVGVGVGEDDIAVVDIVAAAFENEIASHVDIVLQFVCHGFFDGLVYIRNKTNKTFLIGW